MKCGMRNAKFGMGNRLLRKERFGGIPVEKS